MFMKFSMLLASVGLLKLMLNLVHTGSVQGRELYQDDFLRDMFNNGLHSDTLELISFKFCMMMDTNDIHSDTSLNDLDLHCVTGFSEG